MKLVNRKQAIDAHCRDCIYDAQSIGTWRYQVEACTSLNCKLHQFRPLTKSTKETIKQKKYDKMSIEDKEKVDRKAQEVRERFSKG